VGANVAICLVALGLGAWVPPPPFPAGVLPFDESWAGSDHGWNDYGGT